MQTQPLSRSNGMECYYTAQKVYHKARVESIFPAQKEHLSVIRTGSIMVGKGLGPELMVQHSIDIFG